MKRGDWIRIRTLQRLGLTDTVLSAEGIRVHVADPPGGEAFLRSPESFGQFWADPSLQAVIRLVETAGSFWDIGANCGMFSLLALRAKPGLRVLSLEPTTEHYVSLCRNRLLNPSPNWICLNAAAQREPGVLKMTTGQGGYNHVVAGESEANGTTEPCIGVRLDDLAAITGTETVGVMKLDVEGFELDALRGAERLLREKRILALVIEADGHGARYGVGADEVGKYLRDFGYTIDTKLSTVGDQGGNTLVMRSHPTPDGA